MNSSTSFVTWCSLGRIIRCSGSSGKRLCFSLPPTWRNSFLINGCNSEYLLLYNNGRFCFIRVNSLVNLSCWTLLWIKYLLFTKSSKNILVWYVLWFFCIYDKQCFEILETKATTLPSLFHFENHSKKIKLGLFFKPISSSFRYFVSKLMLLRVIGKLSSLQLKIDNSGPS